MSPLGDFQVKYCVPEWLAPNVITLMGFLCVLIPHFYIWYSYPGELQGEIPSWLCVTTGVLHLLYMNLDNLDGKQARKTKNSSPLGLILDHGCDALITGIQGLTLAQFLQFGNSPKTFVMFILGTMTFYSTTIEELYTNKMFLPLVNGASEGCFLIGIFMFFTGYVGTGWWLGESFGLERRDLMFAFFVFSNLANSIGIFQRIQQETGKAFHALLDHAFILGVYLVLFFIYSDSSYGREDLRVILYSGGLIYAKLSSLIQIAHVANVEFKQFRTSNYLVISGLFLNHLSNRFLGFGFNPLHALYLSLFANLVLYLHVVFDLGS